MMSAVETTDAAIAPKTPMRSKCALALAWVAALAMFGNLAAFVIRCADPVIQSDAWYFLDVFLSKAVNGTLTVSDFFVKRYGFDHAQPLFKAINLLELYFFDLNFAVGAFIGALATAGIAILFYRLAVSSAERGLALRCLAWVAMCAVLFSLNAHGMVWTVPLNAVENITNLIILLFFLAVWHAQSKEKYTALAVMTFCLAVSSDDSAILAALAAIIALFIVAATDKTWRRKAIWRVLAAIIILVVLVRIGYAFAPVVGGTAVPSADRVASLVKYFAAGGWWEWTILPLSLPIAYHPVSTHINTHAWVAIQIAIGVIVLITHIWFWVRVSGGEHGRSTFVAIALMVLFYGWLTGIVISRIPVFGNVFIQQPRYVLLFSTQLFALLLLWAALQHKGRSRRVLAFRALQWAPVLSCFLLIVVQIPNSIQSWHMEPYLLAYYRQTALQIDDLVIDPHHPPENCQPWIHVCDWPLQKRIELPRILSDNRLNVYSSKIQRWYPYLPHLSASGQESGEGSNPGGGRR